ncbi:MAG: substrate-binding domain-containing protein, partial [Verrucomicrobiae bacterium]|nr:substrate-binding domain-containing protein [Verrucomicrobiae bacterium]
QMCIRDRLTGCGEPSRPPAMLRVALIGRVQGDAYFDACVRGAREAARELGLQLFCEAPVKAAAEDQIETVKSLLDRRMDAIVIAPADPMALAPTLRRARDSGTHVITFDTDADEKRSGREWFVRPASDQAVGRALARIMALSSGPQARTVIVTSSVAGTGQQLWIGEMRKHIGATFPTMVIADIKRCAEPADAYEAIQTVLRSDGEVSGVFALAPDLLVSAAESVKHAGKGGKIVVTGIGLPKSIAPFVKDGIVPAFVMWNPTDLGYLAVQTACKVVKGELAPDAKEIEAGRLGKRAIQGRDILLGDPIAVSAAKVDSFDF